MTSLRLRIATRKSRLALWQAEFVEVATGKCASGPRDRTGGNDNARRRGYRRPSVKLAAKGLFIKELETAMTDGRADVAVHSMKDVPAELPAGFVLPVIGYRDEVRDVLVSPRVRSVAELPRRRARGLVQSSRQAQLLARRPDLVVAPVRGNVNTRLDKLDAGEYDALLLAGTGLQRLGLAARIREFLSLEDSLPAAGQGALGCECSRETHRRDRAAGPAERCAGGALRTRRASRQPPSRRRLFVADRRVRSRARRGICICAR